MKKQTAVEWLIEQYEKDFPLTFDAMEQAKAMEKEQIVEAFSYGVISHHDAFKNENKFGNGKHYYNETFKSE